MGQIVASLGNLAAKIFTRETVKYPQESIRGWNIVLEARVNALGGEIVKESEEMFQWIPPRASELYLLGSHSYGELVHDIPVQSKIYYLLRLKSGKEVYIGVMDDCKKQQIAVVNAIPARIVGAMFKRIGAELCE